MNIQQTLLLSAIQFQLQVLQDVLSEEEQDKRWIRLHKEHERLLDALERAEEDGDYRKAQRLTNELLELQELIVKMKEVI